MYIRITVLSPHKINLNNLIKKLKMTENFCLNLSFMQQVKA